MFKVGDFVTIGVDVGIVFRTGEELGGDLRDHTAVWFGSTDAGSPEVVTIPTEYLRPGPVPVYKH